MFKDLILIGIGLMAAVVIGLLSIVLVQSDEYAVERSITIDASPDVVFAQLNDLRAWNAWSPWKELDANPQTAISNPSEGKGATYSWNGNDQIGQGTLTILESKPDELVDVERAFVRPAQAKTQLTFTLIPDGDGTQLVWTLHGERNFLDKAACLFTDLDTLIGEKFEQGLLNIRDIAEGNGGVAVHTIAETR